MPLAKPCWLLCVAQVQGKRKAHTRAGVTKELLILLGIGIVHTSYVSHRCPRSSARIEQRPPEPCVGRSNRLGGTSPTSSSLPVYPIYSYPQNMARWGFP